MVKVLRFCFQYIRAFLLIYLCLLFGNMIANLLPFPIPASIVGLLLLFALLASHIVPSAWVKVGCQVFTRYMVVLFVPASIGIMKYYDIFLNQFAPIVIACLVSTFMVMIMVALLSQYLERANVKKRSQGAE